MGFFTTETPRCAEKGNCGPAMAAGQFDRPQPLISRIDLRQLRHG